MLIFVAFRSAQRQKWQKLKKRAVIKGRLGTNISCKLLKWSGVVGLAIEDELVVSLLEIKEFYQLAMWVRLLALAIAMTAAMRCIR